MVQYVLGSDLCLNFEPLLVNVRFELYYVEHLALKRF
jgi:hypothetical protein